ncbi:caspase-1-like isoform X2 [Homalodisca vitripennis]|uniref:caspase-1-like isoform X2 n=1 Tax=Homalodisca vitripennis TaxID=197043 RepID=UPI001EEBA353|nr:caspase-1-like isoform X2 [Homalodisca vitripennis]
MCEPRPNEVVSENGAIGDHDEADVLGSTFYKDKKQKREAVMPVPKHALFYKMDHKYRGIAVILNHENFMPNMKLKPRAGTNVDSEQLEKSLRRLGFQIQVHYDLTVEKIDKIIEKVSQQDHSDNDCFALACLSHGEQGILYAYDAPYKPDTLWSRFTADKCPSLAGKPKLFFIQACQGDQLDGGVMLRSQVDSSPSYRIPAHADFLIAYSTIPEDPSQLTTPQASVLTEGVSQTLTKKLSTTSLTEEPSQSTTPQASVLTEGVSQTLTKKLSTTSLTEDPSQSTTPQATPTAFAPSNEKDASIIVGFYSWRNTMRGSWFMQALCEEINEHGFTIDMLTLLTFVNRKVAVDFESNVPDNAVMHAQKQIPCITFMLTRVLKFSEKTETNEVY